ncbi:OprD family porin [Pseudomonas sp. R5(2019)]|uniref:OprD family porin n=1 Tax=Pseudomonas sp. R5(2019) TaxID=2697566 RepID=UPI00141262AF|nr:OprD family porin [Pseudomonas sp. R5(2019)]NBA94261.1 outer membrane porin, OprD family [Pseudomonas sp. R5(2019)]
MTRPTRLGIAVALGMLTTPAFADFISDSSGKLELKNFYFSRDFRDGFPSQSKREEWAQGFQLNLQSGFTDGVVGVGVDAIGMLGLKLDSSPDRTGTGLLPRGRDGRAEDDYSKFALTAKARISKTELRYGGLIPVLPLLASNSSRLFPQVFNGGQISFKEVDKLTVTAGRVDKVKQRDSSDSEDLTTMGQLGAYSTAVTSDSYRYAGADYQVTPALTLSGQVAELEDFYRRYFAGLKYSVGLGPGKAFTELRYFTAKEIGAEKVGEVDNRVISSNFGYQLGAHRLSGGYQKISGDTAYAYLGGSDTYLFSEQQVSTFALQNERAWHARYDYDFAALGLPGLTFTLRYVKGDNVDPQHISTRKAALLRASGDEGQEWERTTDIAYVVQSGPLKSLGLRWRNATARSNYYDSADENRVILSYVVGF